MKYLAEIRKNKIVKLANGGPNPVNNVNTLFANAGLNPDGTPITKESFQLNAPNPNAAGAIGAVGSVAGNFIQDKGTSIEKDALGNDVTTQTKLSGIGAGATRGASMG